jgi:hypothetical protein
VTTDVEAGAPPSSYVAEVVVASPQPTVLIGTIPPTLRELELSWVARSTAPAPTDILHVRANADAGIHYAWETVVGNGTGAVPGPTAISGQDHGEWVDSVAAGTAAASAIAVGRLVIPAFGRGNLSKGMPTLSFSSGGVWMVAMVWTPAAPITSLAITWASGANFAVGSVFTAWGLVGANP